MKWSESYRWKQRGWLLSSVGESLVLITLRLPIRSLQAVPSLKKEGKKKLLKTKARGIFGHLGVGSCCCFFWVHTWLQRGPAVVLIRYRHRVASLSEVGVWNCLQEKATTTLWVPGRSWLSGNAVLVFIQNQKPMEWTHCTRMTADLKGLNDLCLW